jgi:hypothetical protein
MEWILNEQPNLPEKIIPSTHAQSPDPSEIGSDPCPARPVILCVDFTGFPQENIVLQHVLADLVLKGWLDHYQPAGSSGQRNLVGRSFIREEPSAALPRSGCRKC